MSLGIYEPSQQQSIPHDPIDLSVHLLVEKAICLAWRLLIDNPKDGFDIENADEDEVTHELYEILIDVVFERAYIPGFDGELFEVAGREGKVRDFARHSLDKMPDLLVRIRGRSVAVRSQDGLFIECKPVDRRHPAGQHYCDRGISRFTAGEYAWAMTSALMIAYARDGYSLPQKLLDAFADRESKLGVMAPPAPCPQWCNDPSCDPVFFSTHRREFAYLETLEPAPPITIRHLWLRRCTETCVP